MLSNSETLFTRAKAVIPGGVNSPVRAFKAVGGHPVFFQRANGAHLYDEDGNRYIDYIGSWGPMILGHAHPAVVKAVQDAATRSTSFGAPTRLEVEMAELLCDMVANVEKIRIVNSGTEACMSAIRVARGYTGKCKIIKFAGCYHGHADSFLIQAGSGAATFGTPSSPGVTPGTAADTLIARYNDLNDVKRLFAAHSADIAGVIVEPVAGNMGCILPEPGFLEGLRAMCDLHKALLIFDEVMTGFRLARGGAQEALEVDADLVTYGKIIGAGLPVGAYRGRAEIMQVVSPEGPVYQAGTLSGNPLAMSAGLALLRILYETTSIYTELAEKTAYLDAGLTRVLTERGIPHTTQRIGSMISVFFSAKPVSNIDDVMATDIPRFNTFFHGMLKQGVYLPPAAYESWFLSNALTTADLDATIEAARHA